METMLKKKTKGRPELLAPAGSLEAGYAAFHAGADAIYLGGSRFGARAYAGNFSEEELLRIMDYAHLHGRKVYLAVNTLLKQEEMDALYGYLLPYYEAGLDAIIVQDFGVMQFIRTYFCGIPIHISTQMSISGTYGAAYLKQCGAARIIPARELSLEEIYAVRSEVEIEIECFVHGALCYCYSGQCLFSSMLGGRSGNRGRCAQPCRLPYTVLSRQGHPVSKQGSCLLSPKDLCTIGKVGQLIEAGIDSFKIEGRMKPAAYTAGVTAIYRKYIDQYLDCGVIAVQEKDYQQLLDMGNRSGFTTGYYSQYHGPDMLTARRPAHETGGSTILDTVKKQYTEKELKIPVHAKAYLKTGEPAKLQVSNETYTACAEQGITQAAANQPLTRESLKVQLSKTGNTPFMMESMECDMDDSVFLPKQQLNQLRRDALANLTEQILKPYRRTGNRKPNTIGRAAKQQTSSSPNVFYAAVEEAAQLAEAVKHDFLSRIYLDASMYTHSQFATQLEKDVSLIHSFGKQAYLILPAVFRRKTAQFYEKHWQEIGRTGIDGYLLKTYDELGFIKAQQTSQGCCVLDHSLYAYSNDTAGYFASEGWRHITIPLELNRKELLAWAGRKRFLREGSTQELMAYGYIPLMTSTQCIYRTLGACTKKRGLCYLKDRYAKKFPVKNHCSECYNTIYNTQPLSLIQLPDELDKLHFSAYRLHFTIESAQEVRLILNCSRQSFLEHTVPDMSRLVGAYTNGHYKRGVE